MRCSDLLYLQNVQGALRLCQIPWTAEFARLGPQMLQAAQLHCLAHAELPPPDLPADLR